MAETTFADAVRSGMTPEGPAPLTTALKLVEASYVSLPKPALRPRKISDWLAVMRHDVVLRSRSCNVTVLEPPALATIVVLGSDRIRYEAPTLGRSPVPLKRPTRAPKPNDSGLSALILKLPPSTFGTYVALTRASRPPTVPTPRLMPPKMPTAASTAARPKAFFSMPMFSAGVEPVPRSVMVAKFGSAASGATNRDFVQGRAGHRKTTHLGVYCSLVTDLSQPAYSAPTGLRAALGLPL